MPKKRKPFANGTYYRDGMDSAKRARALITMEFPDIATAIRSLDDGRYGDLADSATSACEAAEELLPMLGGYDAAVTSAITAVLDKGFNVLVNAQVFLPDETKARLNLGALEADLRTAISNTKTPYIGD